MGGEPNQGMWRGIRPTDPAENIPVDIKVHTVDTPVKDSWVMQDSIWTSLNDPVAGNITLNSDQLAAGWYDFMLTMTCTVNHNHFVLEHRNAANTDPIHRIYFMLCAWRTIVHYLNNWYIEENERLYVRQSSGLTGRLMGALWWVKRA